MRPYGQHLLAVGAQRLAAGHQDVGAGGPARQRLHQARRGSGEVLGVVEHEQHASHGEHPHDPFAQRLGRRVAQPYGGHRALEIGEVAQRPQLDEQRAVLVAVGQGVSGVPGQPGLADATRPGQGHDPAPAEHLAHPRQVGPATDEGADRQRGPGRRPAWIGAGLGELLAQHLPFEPPQRRRRVEPQLLGQRGAQSGIGTQRGALAPVGHQRAHQHAHRSLPERLLGQQRLQDGDGLAGSPGVEQGLGVRLGGRGAQLDEPLRLRGHRRVVELGVGRAPPQRERGGELAGAHDGVRRVRARSTCRSNRTTSTASGSTTSR